MTAELRHRIAERAYFASLAGTGSDDVDRWLAAEARETPSGIAAVPVAKPKKRHPRAGRHG